MYSTRTSRFSGFIFSLITICLFTISAQAQYGDGTGVPNDPYRITTAEDLMQLSNSPDDYGKHFILVADIDLSSIMWSGAVIPEFAGSFDGNGFTIRGLTISGGNDLGLFGEIKYGAEVRNLGVMDVDVAGTWGRIGGLAGINHGTITNCYSTGRVSGNSQVGGLVGRSFNQKGGGTVYVARIANCYSTATVNGSGGVGGLVGLSLSDVSNCYSTGIVLGNSGIGGLIGNGSSSNVTNCYSTGTVSGIDIVGGLIGQGGGDVSYCYSTGTVSGEGRIGGLLGLNNRNVSTCFWDVDTSGLTYSEGGLGLTTSQMMNSQIYALTDWLGNPNWVLDSGNDYPHLAWEGTPGDPIPEPTFELDWLAGLGTVEDPYRILDSSQLALVGIATALWDRHFVLMADIDLTGMRWFDAVIPNFSGSFNGNGFAVRGLTISGRSNLGMFGEITSGAEIYDLGIVDVNVAGTGDQIGGLAGSNHGIVTNCYSTGSVSGDDEVGSLLGKNYRGNVTSCYSTVTVSGDIYVGGLVGYNQGTIANCYSTGTVSGTGTDCGGLVGRNWSDLINCYSTGSVSGEKQIGGLVGSNYGRVGDSYSTGVVSGDESIGGLVGINLGDEIINCFWDVETSGLANSDGGTGLTTVEMHTGNTFWGWWCYNAWGIEEGRDYPHLRWENEPGEPIPNPYGGGSGTEADPYFIYTSEQLSAIGLITCDLDKHFSLMADIDLSGFSWSMAVIPTFSGSFNGNGFTVRGVTISGESQLGLFGEITSGAEIYDLGVVDVNVVGTGDQIGGVAGHNHHGNLSNCYSTGTIIGNGEVGGFVGKNSGNVSNCYSNAAVSGNRDVGGLVGYNSNSVSNSYSTGTVSGDEYIGGFIGRNNGHVGNCFWDVIASGQISSDGGEGKATVEMKMMSTFIIWWCDNAWIIDEGRSYPHLQWENTPGEPIPNPYGGGSGTETDPYLIYTAEQLNTIGLVPCDLDKHFTLMVDIDLSQYGGTSFNMIGSADNPFTGVFEGNGNTISNFYYTYNNVYHVGLFGYVSDLNSEIRDLHLNWPITNVGTGSDVGALVGHLVNGTISNCYINEGIVSGDQRVGGLVGVNEQGTINNCGSSATVSGSDSIGGLIGLNSGTITNCGSTSHVMGNNDIGGLVGYNGSIWHDTNTRRRQDIIYDSYSMAAVSITSNSETGTICDSYSLASVLGTGSSSGGLVGENFEGQIDGCFSYGIVLGNIATGGLVGSNHNNISSCYSVTDVGGNGDVGGLAGENIGTVVNCFSAGIVLGDEITGGLIGYNGEGEVLVSFWDIETSGQYNMCGNKEEMETCCDDSFGLTTAEMQTTTTFLEVGWDFVDETENGTEDIWWILEGQDYPRLWWELIPEN